ncbi:MerR family transcriptional regulator [Actinomadura sp. 9N215]|uniref:helix-turn-helix domain-containing protein n=1 Tax=Actinomadura sp. 9N215 TaxID=3375150 RepID=UPI0037BFB9A3
MRDLPNERLIRWYTTIGLIDPPLGRRGRTALYGPRHLLQLVAVKRRQAAGRSIAEIQIELAAATDATLERIASLPTRPAPASGHTAHPAVRRADSVTQAALEADGGGQADASMAGRPADPAGSAGGSTPFAPAPTDSVATEGESAGLADPMSRPTRLTSASTGSTDSAASESGAPANPAAGPMNHTAASGTPADLAGTTEQEGETSRGTFWSTRPDVSYSRATVADGHHRPLPPIVQGVRLASGLTLLLDVPTLSGDDLAAIENAARPLLETLHRRGLLVPAESPAFPSADPSRRSQ